jgi:hypothetical protein
MNDRRGLPSFMGFFFACAWPGLHFLSVNVMQFQWMGSAALVLVVILCVFIWLTGMAIAFGPRLLVHGWPAVRLLSVLTVVIFLLFFHQSINTLLKSSLGLDQSVASWAYKLVFVAGIVIIWRFSGHAFIRTAICFGAGIMLAFSLIGLVNRAAVVGGAGSGVVRTEPFTSNVLAGNNVYYIILDHYAGKDALLNYAEYDNSPFLSAMQEFGFLSLNSARSSYTSTYASLISTLDMKYLSDDLPARYGNRLAFFPYRLQHGPIPTVVGKLHSAGYKFMHVGNAWAPCVRSREVSCSSREDMFDSYREVVNVFLAPTRLPALIRWLFVRSDALTVLSDSLEDIVAAKQPFFVFVHSLDSHPPYPDMDCKRDGEANLSKGGYRNAIACVNRKVLDISHRIRLLDPEAIVVFQSDHGSDFTVDWSLPLVEWDESAIDERTAILNLIHLPAACRQQVRSDLLAVNTMRLVYACLERKSPAYLDPRIFLTGYESSPDYGLVLEVTDRLQLMVSGKPLN